MIGVIRLTNEVTNDLHFAAFSADHASLQRVTSNNTAVEAAPTYRSRGTSDATTSGRWRIVRKFSFYMLLYHQSLALFAVRQLGHLA